MGPGDGGIVDRQIAHEPLDDLAPEAIECARQAPVVHGDGAAVTDLVGSIQERALLDRVFRDPDALQADVAQVMGPPMPLIAHDAPIDAAYEELQRVPAILVAKGDRAMGILTRSDLLEYLAHRQRA